VRPALPCLGSIVGLVGALALGAGCSRRPPPEERVDGWPLARAALVSGEHCFAGRAAYCIKDDAFVDAAIRPHLDDLYGGEMPERRSLVEATIRAAALRYRKAQLEPSNTARVEALVRARYDASAIEREGDGATVELGVVPGPLVPQPRTSSLRIEPGPLAPDGDLAREELVRHLLAARAAHPDARVLRVVATLPSGHALVTRTYRWIAAESRLVVATGAELRATPPLPSLEALRDPAVPFGFRALAPCPSAPPLAASAASSAGPMPCPPEDRPR